MQDTMFNDRSHFQLEGIRWLKSIDIPSTH